MSSEAVSGTLRPLRILHVEDSPFDHELLRAQLLAGGLQVELLCVASLADCEAAWEQGWDALICDHKLPDATGLQVLAWLRARDAVLPFLLVSGEIGEDVAVQAMREGASDYLLKGRLARLVPALQQALKAADAERARSRAMVELQASQAQLAALAGHLQRRIEAERAQLSRELHDDVGSALTALKFELGWLQRHAEPALAGRVAQATETLDGAIAASRRLMQNLRPPILDEGLMPALHWLTQQFERSQPDVSLVFSHPGAELALPPELLLVAYRFVQEALHNIAKHAQARHVRVELQWGSGVLGLEVEDDGCGLPEGALEQAERFGLSGLRERAAAAGGWVDVSSRPGQGTLLALNLPLGNDDRRWEEAA